MTKKLNKPVKFFFLVCHIRGVWAVVDVFGLIHVYFFPSSVNLGSRGLFMLEVLRGRG